MVDLDLVGIHLLHQASEKMMAKRWMKPFGLSWICTGLLSVVPFAEKGSTKAMAITYLLIGALIFNTSILYLCCRLPPQIVPLKSVEIEMFGGCLLKLMGKGLLSIGKKLLSTLFQWIDAIVAPRCYALVKM